MAVQEQTVNWRGIGIYIGIAGVGAISVVALARAMGSISGPLAAVIFLFMFTPAISAVIARWLTGKQCSNAIFNLKLPMKKRLASVQECISLI